jgi:hypothetical protein
VDYSNYTIKCTIIDEGVATCVMSLTCWKSIGSWSISQSMTILTTFDGRYFRPHDIISSFLVQLGGNPVEVDAPLQYNLFLGSNWTYAMTTVMLSIFHTLFFPHEGKIVTIDQFSCTRASPNALVGTSILVIDISQLTTEDIGVKMYSSLMGTFDFMTLVHHICTISNESSSSMRFVPFHTLYFNDPWTLPFLTLSGEDQSHIGKVIPLSATKVVYQACLNTSIDLDPISSQTNEEDHVLEPVWDTQSSCSHDFLDDTLPSYESILEAMNGPDRPWDDMHHHSYFFLELVRINHDEFRSTLSDMVSHAMISLDTHGVSAGGNMVNIYPTMPIDISRIPRKIENVYIGVDCSPEEIQFYTDLFKEFC